MKEKKNKFPPTLPVCFIQLFGTALLDWWVATQNSVTEKFYLCIFTKKTGQNIYYLLYWTKFSSAISTVNVLVMTEINKNIYNKNVSLDSTS